MKAMLLEQLSQVNQNSQPLHLREVPVPQPGEGELLLRISACGVCHTELDEIEGRTPPPRLPVILGHQVVGRVAALGSNARRFSLGERLGAAWIYSACGRCRYCLAGEENLCPHFRATGRDAHGGYAEYFVIHQDYTFPIPESLSDEQAAPLLCAGAIGYRSLRLTNIQDGQALGLTGFGASGHLVLKLARHLYPAGRVYVFARSPRERQFALDLGAAWAGDTADQPPEKMQAIIDTTPAWKPVVAALANLSPGGRLVINAIRKEAGDQAALLNLDYPQHLWLEKEIKSVANVTRRDVSEFLALAAAANLAPEVRLFPLEDANHALLELKRGGVPGAKVLKVS